MTAFAEPATTRHPSRTGTLPRGERDFSVIPGGPLFRLLVGARLAGPALERLPRRTVILCAIAWVPLCVLSLVEGRAFGGTMVPFFADIALHVRLLIALPLLLAAEVAVHRVMPLIVREFVDRGIVPDAARERFGAAVASALRWRDSTAAEIVLLAIVYGAGIAAVWHYKVALGLGGWYGDSAAGAKAAGWWYAAVSLPLFQFIFFRWSYKILVWARFLWQVSRMPLHLVPTHPDGRAGLGFLAEMGLAFAPFLLAHGAILAGTIADRIFFAGDTLSRHVIDIALVVAFGLLLVLGPLLSLTPRLFHAKQHGLLKYGALAERYVREFDAKWFPERAGAAPDDALLGAADIQSLADLGNSFSTLRSMQLFAFTTEGAVLLAAVTLAPVAPLLLTMIPAGELLERLAKLLL